MLNSISARTQELSKDQGRNSLSRHIGIMCKRTCCCFYIRILIANLMLKVIPHVSIALAKVIDIVDSKGSKVNLLSVRGKCKYPNSPIANLQNNSNGERNGKFEVHRFQVCAAHDVPLRATNGIP